MPKNEPQAGQQAAKQQVRDKQPERQPKNTEEYQKVPSPVKDLPLTVPTVWA